MGGGHRTGRPSTEEECGVIIVIEDGDCKVQNWFGVMMVPGYMLAVIQFVSVSFHYHESLLRMKSFCSEPGCDERFLTKLRRQRHIKLSESSSKDLVTFSCSGSGFTGSLYCNGSHWLGDTRVCGGNERLTPHIIRYFFANSECR